MYFDFEKRSLLRYVLSPFYTDSNIPEHDFNVIMSTTCIKMMFSFTNHDHLHFVYGKRTSSINAVRSKWL